MKLEDLKLSDLDKNSLLERLKDLRVSSPSTAHPIDFQLQKLGLVSVKNGSTTYIGKQTVYCNVCGTKMFVAIAKIGNFDGRFCSLECLHEFEWRKTLSIMGKEYYPNKI